MTQEIIKAVRGGAKRIRAIYRESKKLYDRLDRKSRTANGLDFGESETHDFEDGFSSALHIALVVLADELTSVGIKL